MKRPHAVISMSDLQEKGPSSIYFVHRIILSNQSQCEPPHTDSSCPGAFPGPGKTTGKTVAPQHAIQRVGPWAFHQASVQAMGCWAGVHELAATRGLREHVVEGPFSSGKF